MYRLRKDLAFIADIFEGIADFQEPKGGPFLDLDSLILTAPFDIAWLIDYLNGERPISGRTIEEIQQAADYIGLRIKIDFNNLEYENYLYEECPTLFKDRMKDLTLRWKWSRPNSGLAPFENCIGPTEINNLPVYDIPQQSIMARSPGIPFGVFYNPSQILINDEEELTNSLPWYNSATGTGGLILAGGSVLNTLHGSELPIKDYDLFIVAKTPEEAKEIVRAAIFTINSYYKNRGIPFMFVSHVGTTVTYNFPKNPEHKNIQIILRAYESPAQVINGFDIDASCVGFTPERGIFVATRAGRALRHGWNMIDPMCQSPSYEYRMKKYHSNYELGVYIPCYKNLSPNLDYMTTFSDGIYCIEETSRAPFPGISGLPVETFNKHSYNVHVYSTLVKVIGFFKLLMLFSIKDYTQGCTENSSYARCYTTYVKYLELYSESKRMRQWSKWIRIIDNFLNSEGCVIFDNPQAQRRVFGATSQPRVYENWYNTFNFLNQNAALINAEIQSLRNFVTFNKDAYLNNVVYKINALKLNIETVRREIKKIFTNFVGCHYFFSIKKCDSYEKYRVASPLEVLPTNLSDIYISIPLGYTSIDIKYKLVDTEDSHNYRYSIADESSDEEMD